MKIDLAEIRKLEYKLKFCFQVQDLKSASLKRDDGLLLIEALIELPKLVKALQYSNRGLTQASKRVGDDDFYDRAFIDQALEPFTNQPQP